VLVSGWILECTGW